MGIDIDAEVQYSWWKPDEEDASGFSGKTEYLCFHHATKLTNEGNHISTTIVSKNMDWECKLCEREREKEEEETTESYKCECDDICECDDE